MNDDQVEVSSTGLRFSYLRFLADGAAGLFMVLLLLAAYYLNLPLPGYGPSQTLLEGSIGRETKVLILVLCVALAVPAGLMINAFGFFIFGWLQSHAAGRWLRCRRLIAGTARLWQLDVLMEQFCLTPENLYQKAQFYEELLLVVDPARVIGLYHVEGLKRLWRSAVIISLLCAVYFALVGLWFWMFIWIVIMLIFFVGLSLLEFYHSLAILFRAYVATMRECRLPETSEAEPERRILADLLEEKKKTRSPQADRRKK